MLVYGGGGGVGGGGQVRLRLKRLKFASATGEPNEIRYILYLYHRIVREDSV